MKLQLLVLFLFLVLIFGCKNDTSESKNIFVGGEIVNPKSEYFILSKGSETIDTLYLNQNNQFGKNFEGLEEGIYNFTHPPENQILYLQPGDSLLIWLNTLAFDESINYSGRGASKSSFLLDMFLNNEQNNQLVLSYYRIPPPEFARLTDSIKDDRKVKLEALVKNRDYSEDFLDIARASIDYEYFHLRERYSFLTQKYYREMAREIPQDFHDYRSDIDFNNENLDSYYVYTNFIDDYLRTQAIERCAKSSNPNSDCFDLNSFENIKYRILLGDSLIQNKKIKNRFLDRLASQGITFSKDAESMESIIDLLDSIGYASDNRKDLEQMAIIQMNLLPGNNIGELELTNVNADTVSLKEISDKPVVTYHWSMYSKDHFYWQQKEINKLRVKYPEVRFIGINIDEGVEDTWAAIVKNESEHPEFEFHLTFARVNRDLLKSYLYKLFFLKPDGEIIQGTSQLNSPTFEKEILEFLNKY